VLAVKKEDGWIAGTLTAGRNIVTALDWAVTDRPLPILEKMKE